MWADSPVLAVVVLVSIILLMISEEPIELNALLEVLDGLHASDILEEIEVAVNVDASSDKSVPVDALKLKIGVVLVKLEVQGFTKVDVWSLDSVHIFSSHLELIEVEVFWKHLHIKILNINYNIFIIISIKNENISQLFVRIKIVLKMKNYSSILFLALTLNVLRAAFIEDSLHSKPMYDHPFKGKDIKSIYHVDRKHLQVKLQKVKTDSYTLRHVEIDPKITPKFTFLENLEDMITTKEEAFVQELRNFWKTHDIFSSAEVPSHPKV